MISRSQLAAWKEVYEAHGAKALIDVTSGHTNHAWGSELWCAAMTEWFGPGNIHPSRCDDRGRPTAETIAEFSTIAYEIERAKERIDNVFSFLASPDHPWFAS